RMQSIRNRYGTGPLLLRIPWRSVALILNPDDVHRVLAHSPEPFATETPEKRAALAHFEPQNVLISQGADRRDRRRFNEQALDTDRPAHRLAETFLDIVNSEAGRLHEQARQHGELNWEIFSDAWFRIVRRVIFGDAARDDEELSVMMAKLRAAANWAFLRPRRPQLRQQLLDRIHHYLSIAEPAS